MTEIKIFKNSTSIQKGTVVDAYSQEEYQALQKVGDWQGGYVEYSGYSTPSSGDEFSNFYDSNETLSIRLTGKYSSLSTKTKNILRNLNGYIGEINITDNSGKMVPSVAHAGTARSAQMVPVVVQ